MGGIVTGGTLLVSRAVNWQTRHKKRLEELGFWNVSVTSAEKEELNDIINKLQPKLMIIGSAFYDCATPYMMAILHKQQKKMKIATVSICKYPADLAIKFIVNGVSSYINYYDGYECFYEGLNYLRKGENYISPSIQERMNEKEELPRPSREVTEKQIEVLQFLYNGFTSIEIAEKLSLSKRSIEYYKSELFNNFGTRNELEVVRVAEYLGLIKNKGMNFHGGNWALGPKTKEKIKEKKEKR